MLADQVCLPGEASASPAMLRIVALLQMRGVLSAQEIAEGAFVARTTLEGGGYLKRMKSLGLIRVEGWAKNSNGFTTPLYAAGGGQDCPRPKFAREDRDSRGMARIVEVLCSGDALDYREIAVLAGLSAHTVKNAGYMEVLVRQGKVHVSAWRRNARGRIYPLYRAGGGENVEKPAMLTRQEIMCRYRERKRVLSGRAGSLEGQLKSLLDSRK